MAHLAEVETELNTETGEILGQKARIRDVEPEPDYVKLYVRAWLVFKDISGINSNFLINLLPYMSYAETGQVIYLAPALKRKIADELGWSPKSALDRFNQELRKLVKHGVLTHIGTGAYAVNPELIGKGNWADIKKLRATFEVIGPDAGKVTPEAE